MRCTVTRRLIRSSLACLPLLVLACSAGEDRSLPVPEFGDYATPGSNGNVQTDVNANQGNSEPGDNDTSNDSTSNGDSNPSGNQTGNSEQGLGNQNIDDGSNQDANNGQSQNPADDGQQQPTNDNQQPDDNQQDDGQNQEPVDNTPEAPVDDTPDDSQQPNEPVDNTPEEPIDNTPEEPVDNTPPAPPPPPAGFYFLDDFEGGRSPLWSESLNGNGAISLDTSLGANGSSSSVRVDANFAFHTMLQMAIPQEARNAGEIYGRVFLRLAQAPSGAHYIWIEVGTEVNDGHEMRIGHNVGQLQSNHWLNGEQDIRDQERALGANQWYCVEFFMGNNPDELRVWLDGEETNLSTTNYVAGPGAQGNGQALTDFIPQLDAFRIGWELQNGTVWFDDVALAPTQIGCQ